MVATFRTASVRGDLPDRRPAPFAREADMLAPLLASAPSLTGRSNPDFPFFEVQTTKGVVDLVFADPDIEILARREAVGLHPVLDVASVATLMTLTAVSSYVGGAGVGVRTVDLAERVSVSVGHLRRMILPSLSEAGWITESRDGGWLAQARYEPCMRRIVAIEAKRNDWRQALTQASPHTAFADRTYVALDAAMTPDLSRLALPFTLAGVGLLTVASRERRCAVRREILASRHRPLGFARAVVSERIAALREEGTRSGPIGHVFGKQLTTSVGLDPRVDVLV